MGTGNGDSLDARNPRSPPERLRHGSQDRLSRFRSLANSLASGPVVPVAVCADRVLRWEPPLFLEVFRNQFQRLSVSLGMSRHRAALVVSLLFASAVVALLGSRFVSTQDVTASAPPPGTNLTIDVAAAVGSGKLTVGITNSSRNTIRIWSESNSWGAMNWRIFVVRNGKVESFFQNPNQLFSKNTPEFNEIKTRQRITRQLDLNGGNWCGRGVCSWWDERGFGGKSVKFERGDTILVVYDVRPTNEAVQMSVWYGVTASNIAVQ